MAASSNICNYLKALYGQSQWNQISSHVSRVFLPRGLRGNHLFSLCFLLFYFFVQGDEHGATLTLNDMGNYGCYPDCEEEMSMPLYTEAIVNLMRKQPMDSFLAHSKLQIS